MISTEIERQIWVIGRERDVKIAQAYHDFLPMPFEEAIDDALNIVRARDGGLTRLVEFTHGLDALRDQPSAEDLEDAPYGPLVRRVALLVTTPVVLFGVAHTEEITSAIFGVIEEQSGPELITVIQAAEVEFVRKVALILARAEQV